MPPACPRGAKPWRWFLISVVCLAAACSCDVEHGTGWAGGAEKVPVQPGGRNKGLFSVLLWLVRSMRRAAEINRWLVFLQVSTMSFTWWSGCMYVVVAAMYLFSEKLWTSLYLVFVKTVPWNSLHFCWFWILYVLKCFKIIHMPLPRFFLVFF